MQNSGFWSRITSLCVYQTSPVVLCMQISVISTRITGLYGFQPSSVVLHIQNSDLKTKMACVYWSQTSLVIFCIQNSVPSIRNTDICGFQPSSVVFACKTASVVPELHVSMSPRLHLSICEWRTAWFASELLVSLCPSPHLWFLQRNWDFWIRITSFYGSLTSPVILCMQNSVISISITSLYRSQPSSVAFAFKTEAFGPELQISMCPWPHLSFCAWKTTWLAPAYLPLWVQALISGFCMQNSDFWTRITSFYRCQTSPVTLCMQNNVITIRITSLYGFQPSSMVFACKTATFRTE